ncbi:MAG: proton extrusion protein PcxA [Stigonema ocellatum SAG 48.90 = DSM 106950]|nr:proton extrusion protein PcxA [Stigonema ocellatum SAG 48.90 = DSM 106950]
MNYSVLGQKIYNILLKTYKWYLRTPERSLDEAYKAAGQIKAIESEHFNGKKIDSDSAMHTSSVMDYFESDLKKQLKIIRMRLTEFKASRFFLDESNQKAAKRLGIEHPHPSVILEKLKFIDEVIAKYNTLDDENTYQDRGIHDTNITVEPATIQAKSQNLIIKKSHNNLPRSKADTTRVLPRSIFNTFNRLQVELVDPNAEKEVVQDFRRSRKRTITSVRFLLLLILVPFLTYQLSKPFVVGPIVEHFRSSSAEVALFLNHEMEEEALSELQKFEERIRFENLIQNKVSLSPEDMEPRLQEKARDIAEEYRDTSANAIKNVFADILAVAAFSCLLLISKREIAMIKEFFDNIVYGLSDSAKAFIIILFTDIFVGFHSPHGWEVLLEGISRHWGLPSNHDFIFLFIATFPVILDTIFKYWIFRYLNRISPSAVATYRNMNE